jgi:transposase
LRFKLTSGNRNDCPTGYKMLEAMELAGINVMADRAYDTDKIVKLLQQQHAIIVIPSKKNRLVQRECDWWLYKERHLVECFFNKIKNYRRLATRYDKLSCSFLAFLQLASIIIWLT